MAPPPAMLCSFPKCDFETPASIPTYEFVIKALELHIQTAHQTQSIRSQVVPKLEKPKRPVLHSSMTESDWIFFEHKWARYQRQSQISGQQLTDEIWACLDSDLERLAFQDGLTETDPTQLLQAVKNLAVTTVHPALHVVALHETRRLISE